MIGLIKMKKQNQYSFSLALFAIMLCMAPTCKADGNGKYILPKATVRRIALSSDVFVNEITYAPGVVVSDYGDYLRQVLAAKWDGDDRPYVEARSEAELAVSRASNPLVVIDAYKTQAVARPRDPLLQFRWAAAAIKFVLDDPYGSIETASCLKGLDRSLVCAYFPRTYEYARAEYLTMNLMSARMVSSILLTPTLPIADRLLTIQPRDVPVMLIQAVHLAGARPDASKIRRAISLVEAATAANPGDYRIYRGVGGVYYYAYEATGDPAYGAAAKSAFSTFLEKVPNPQSPDLGMIRLWMTILDDRLKNHWMPRNPISP